ncbi:hypothetical protein CVS42_11255 [Aeromonas veronii]|uniref:DUF1367 family protein n=1 Tax=Aeromonas veronii TaxID=654 RepID=UPI000C285DDC|nr:DUF1367 family protein [Aeromonas veronii]ATY81349.1 hypothetical protein CVS42_11255 [Aeromonas veronii]
MDLTLLRMSGGVLVPSTPADAEVIRLMPIGTTIQAQGRGRRNPAFHRRFFALLNLTFDYWEPTGGLVSPAEQRILDRFVRYLSRFGASHTLDQAKEEFIDQLASLRVERHGPQAEKSFEVMRKWLTVEAGYFTIVILPDGGMRKEAKSVSFAKMDQAEFSDLYRAVFGVCWRYVLSKQFATEEEAENACAQLMGFAG